MASNGAGDRDHRASPTMNPSPVRAAVRGCRRGCQSFDSSERQVSRGKSKILHRIYMRRTPSFRSRIPDFLPLPLSRSIPVHYSHLNPLLAYNHRALTKYHMSLSSFFLIIDHVRVERQQQSRPRVSIAAPENVIITS
ncbi:f784fd0b-05b3-4d25-9b87-353c5b57217b [Thermothielavioides terrestris]|uniref:F784fd0b-05b3-4d25-9b87-353c5b57217b n=1 Tax=Thermothielavioides terrestris TaxID=2587410 RepID=A0A3S4D3I6_9PEZI|nr:f784fd0b-05b3-4d25-9b87-353c5b57217b [Thermothielavioides terrestris]